MEYIVKPVRTRVEPPAPPRPETSTAPRMPEWLRRMAAREFGKEESIEEAIAHQTGHGEQPGDFS